MARSEMIGARPAATRVRLDYGVDGLEVDFPHERVTIIEPVFRPAIADPHAALTAALRAPLGRPPLRELVRRGQTIAISVCDITRAQPRQEMLTALFAEMPDIRDRKSTRLNSSHGYISYAVFCLKKKKKEHKSTRMKSTHVPFRKQLSPSTDR